MENKDNKHKTQKNKEYNDEENEEIGLEEDNLGYENLNEIVVIENIILSIFVYQVFLNLFKMYLNLVNYEIGKDYLKYIICSFLSMIILTIFGKMFSIEHLDYLRINFLQLIATNNCDL